MSFPPPSVNLLLESLVIKKSDLMRGRIFLLLVFRKSVLFMPKTGKILEEMGVQIRLARMRRKIPAALVAERAGVSRASVWAVEKGSAAVAIGIYAAVLHAINGLDKDLLKIAADDELGQKLRDIELLNKYRKAKALG